MHEFLAGDGLLLIEEGRQTVQLLPVRRKDVHRLVMLPLHQLHHLLVDLGLGIGGAGQRGVTPQILVGDGLQRHHTEVVAHAVAGDHGTGQFGGLLDVVGGPGGNRAERHLLGSPAAGKGSDLVLHLLLGHEVVVALLHLHRVAQGTGGAGYDGDLLHRGGVGLHGRHQRMADLITPYITDIVRDSVLLVSFDAVAYVADDGAKDNNKLTINILNGGEFADTHTTTKTIELNYYDPLDEDILHTMWSKGRHDFYVVSPPERPITANTKIQIIGGDYILTTGNNRVFVDNFYVYRLDNVYYYLLEE